MEINERNIFDIITDSLINEKFDNDLLNNEDYINIQNKISIYNKQMDNILLTKEQRLIIDRAICSRTESGALYGRMLYKQGFRDCVSLLQEVGLIKAS